VLLLLTLNGGQTQCLFPTLPSAGATIPSGRVNDGEGIETHEGRLRPAWAAASFVHRDQWQRRYDAI